MYCGHKLLAFAYCLSVVPLVLYSVVGIVYLLFLWCCTLWWLYTGLPGRPAHGWWDIPVKN